ncbi:beta-N-acetylhexosaminidase [Echinicola marina]|uniref:beta-N-acetylhexosaminidase n=1 Tax=Echinicola marina TaxID=2859768 RepID=UPI001CF6A9E3|nr:beta-N-acetylhexosaminidase [Echinicola marina]UCS95465.1 beta-N-acetylhexosaminidase [Echinicola marina]
MKIFKLLFLSNLLLQFAFAQETPPVIPTPLSFEGGTALFVLNKNTAIQYVNEDLKDEAHFLQKELLKKQQLPLSLTQRNTEAAKIILKTSSTENDGYKLSIRPEQIQITSNDENGIFYGIVSLLQIIDQAKSQGSEFHIATWDIKDRPEYAWRGFMLDESRHFFGKEKVKSILDWMAYYKLNKFHWHLTDAPGWRIEIQKYPKLGLVGGIGDHINPFTPSQYYTQEEIKEIVQYAQERKIEVIPEIDMPGHATAANRAYPEFSGGGSEKHPEFTFHPGKEATYQYLTDILREIDVLFPSQMIHLGGDEVSFGNQKWASDPLISKLRQKENLSSLKEVEDYFIKRMADSLFSLNNKILAWDEMAEAGLPTEKSILFWWRHDKPEQLSKLMEHNIPTVICPRIPLYFDFVQDETHRNGRKWGGNFNPLQRVYEFDLSEFNIPESKKDLILGFQANLWTETVSHEERLDFLVFPRIAAMAEAVWNHKNNKNYEDFSLRVKNHFRLYKNDGLYFYDPFHPDTHPEPVIK